jgi:cytochrome c oxidase assembly factor CtaG
MRALLAIAAALLLIAPPVDPFLDAVMRRHMELQLPALVLLGFMVGRGRPAPRWVAAINASGLAGLALALGSMAFWMIPRSLDAAVVDNTVDQVLHASMFSSGLALAWSLPVAPFALRITLAIHGVAMVGAMALVYSGFPRLICATYNLEQQRAVGGDLLWVAGLLCVMLCVAVVREFGRRAEHPAEDARKLAGPLRSASHRR